MKPNPLFSQFVCERLKLAREEAGGTLPWSHVSDIIQKAYIQEITAFTARLAPPTAKRAPVKRERNEFIDTLAEATGSNPIMMTPAAIRTVAIAWAEIKTVSPACTVEEIRTRAAVYKRKHPEWPLTATALSKHWDQLGSSSGRTASAALDVYTEPLNWRERAASVFPEADFTEVAWCDVSILVRKDILTKTK